MKISEETRRTLLRIALELGIYALLVAGYMYLILRAFTGVLVELFHGDRVLYAGFALGLMVLQGIILESLTTFLIDRLGL